jgi:hypothetical protein
MAARGGGGEDAEESAGINWSSEVKSNEVMK